MNWKIFGLIALSVTFSSCVPASYKAGATEGIAQFHRRYNSNQFGEIYDNSEPSAKEKISRADFIQDMEAMRRGQGAVISSSELQTDYNHEGGIWMVKVLVEVVFEKGNAKEEFIFYFSGDNSQLASYRFLGPTASEKKKLGSAGHARRRQPDLILWL